MPPIQNFLGTFLLKFGHYKISVLELFGLKKILLVSVQKIGGGGVKVILTMSKKEQLFYGYLPLVEPLVGQSQTISWDKRI